MIARTKSVTARYYVMFKTSHTRLNPLNPDLPLWICTPDIGLPAATSSLTRRCCVRSRSNTFEFAEYRPHKSLQSLSDCLVYSNNRYAEIIVQKLITLMKETESTNENIAAVVDKFPKLRTTELNRAPPIGI